MLTYQLEENGKNKGFGFAVMPEHVQKELLKLPRDRVPLQCNHH